MYTLRAWVLLEVAEHVYTYMLTSFVRCISAVHVIMHTAVCACFAKYHLWYVYINCCHHTSIFITSPLGYIATVQ